MTPENLAVLRNIQYNYGAWKACEPRVRCMKDSDRLIVCSTTRPELPALEWKEAEAAIWIGRKPSYP